MKLVHYGADKYDPSKFKPATNKPSPFTKPVHGTGLWASPVDSAYGWIDWCNTERFHLEKLEKSFLFEIKNGSSIFVIDTLEDLLQLPLLDPESAYGKKGLDFEKIREDCDALILTEAGEWNTRYSKPVNLYGWDCECVLMLNDKIVPL
jgi:hypothetical protein